MQEAGPFKDLNNFLFTKNIERLYNNEQAITGESQCSTNIMLGTFLFDKLLSSAIAGGWKDSCKEFDRNCTVSMFYLQLALDREMDSLS